jgi:cysteine desulfurase family protein (TIGR01976 family)
MEHANPDAAPVASTRAIRAHFPALERTHRGAPVAYFDGPGGTQVPRAVVEAMTNYLYHHNANTHWAFPTSQETDATITQARLAVADFVNASPAEIVFGANMTTLTFHLARALGRRLGPGDEIVVTELDHHANIDPWRALSSERGVTLRVVRMDPATGRLDFDDLDRQLNPRTKLLALGAASNALGTITDVREAGRRAHDLGALVFVDAVHYAPHHLVDVRAFDCDFLACSAYKFYGPHVGVLYGRRDLLGSLDVPKLQPAPDSAPDRLETGTQNHEGLAGVAAAVDFLASLAPGLTPRARLETAFEVLHERGNAQLERLWHGLTAIEGVQVYGPPPGTPRTPTIAFTVGDRPSAEVARELADRGVFVSDGNFYAMTVVERLGRSRQGLVRAGCACYTTLEDLERIIEGVRALSRGQRLTS